MTINWSKVNQIYFKLLALENMTWFVYGLDMDCQQILTKTYPNKSKTNTLYTSNKPPCN